MDVFSDDQIAVHIDGIEGQVSFRDEQSKKKNNTRTPLLFHVVS